MVDIFGKRQDKELGSSSLVTGPLHRFARTLSTVGTAALLSLSASTAFAQNASTLPSTSHNASLEQSGGAFDLLVGTYTIGSDSKGIYVYRFDTHTGKAALLSTAAAVNPSYLAISKDHSHVYTVNEVPGDTKPGSKGGNISAFAFDAQQGQLRFINQVASQGNDPTYLVLSPDERYLVTANYSVAADPGGSLAMFPVAASGEVRPAVISVHHDGSGPVRGRQDNSHVHSTVFSPDGQYLFAQDLGVDKVYAYNYRPDDVKSPLSTAPSSYTTLPAGSGPRHIIFDASGKHAYLTTEMNASVTVFDYQDGRLKATQTISMTAPDFKGAVGGGAIHLSADGRFLYTTNRGDANQIVTFTVAPGTGHLTLIDRTASLGKTPREFAIDPSGKWFFVGNQDSNSVFVLHRDPDTGRLGEVAAKLDIGSPVYFAFVPVK